jgi:hypothetical protein
MFSCLSSPLRILTTDSFPSTANRTGYLTTSVPSLSYMYTDQFLSKTQLATYKKQIDADFKAKQGSMSSGQKKSWKLNKDLLDSKVGQLE